MVCGNRNRPLHSTSSRLNSSLQLASSAAAWKRKKRINRTKGRVWELTAAGLDPSESGPYSWGASEAFSEAFESVDATLWIDACDAGNVLHEPKIFPAPQMRTIPSWDYVPGKQNRGDAIQPEGNEHSSGFSLLHTRFAYFSWHDFDY